MVATASVIYLFFQFFFRVGATRVSSVGAERQKPWRRALRQRRSLVGRRRRRLCFATAQIVATMQPALASMGRPSSRVPRHATMNKSTIREVGRHVRLRGDGFGQMNQSGSCRGSIVTLLRPSEERSWWVVFLSC